MIAIRCDYLLTNESRPKKDGIKLSSFLFFFVFSFNSITLFLAESELLITNSKLLNILIFLDAWNNPLHKEIKDKKGWGHSSIEDGVIFHKKSKAKKLFISHHAPERSDKDLDSMSKTMLPKGVFFAKENQKIKLT